MYFNCLIQDINRKVQTAGTPSLACYEGFQLKAVCQEAFWASIQVVGLYPDITEIHDTGTGVQSGIIYRLPN